MLVTNKNAALAHLFSAIVLLVLYAHYPASHTRSSLQLFKYRITGENTDPNCVSGSTSTPSQCDVDIGYQSPSDVLKINVIFGALLFFAITFVAHSFYAMNGFNGSYSKYIKEGWNPYRWFEYAASASIMSVLLGTTEGVRDVSTLFLMAIITVAMQMNGFATESLLRGTEPIKKNALVAIRASQYSGWALFVGLWVVLFYNFGVIVHDVPDQYPTTPAAKVPSWIWVIVIAQFVYYISFGIVQSRHISQRLSSKHFDYSSIEKSYITLSFTAKLSLAAGLGYGLIFRTKDC